MIYYILEQTEFKLRVKQNHNPCGKLNRENSQNIMISS